MNIFDIVLIALIAAAVCLAVWRIIVNKRRGKGCSGCCEGCSGCAAKNRTESDQSG